MQGIVFFRSFILPALLFSCMAYAGHRDSLVVKTLQDSFLQQLYKDPRLAMQYAMRLDSVATVMDDAGYKGIANNYQGMAHNVMGNTSLAIEKFLEGLKLFEALGDTYQQAVLMNNLGAAHNALNESEKTIEYYALALEKFRTIGDSSWMSRVLYNISTQKNAQGLYEEDLKLKNEVYAILRRKPNPSLEGVLKPNYAHTLFSLGHFDAALDSIEAYLGKTQYHGNKSIYTNALLTYAFILDTLGHGPRSLTVTHQALDIAGPLGFTEKAMKAMLHLAKLYAKTGDYSKAYRYMTGYHELYAAHFNETKDATINELLIRYDTEKKEHDITLLNSENALKDAQIARGNLFKYLLISGILLMAVLAFLAWRVQRLKSKANRLLNELNRQLSDALEGKNILLKEIHHRVKNNLQVISSLLKLQSRHITDASAVKAIAEGRNRVHAMALLHQNLYREDHLTGVDMQVYFQSLIESLFDVYRVHPGAIQLKTQISPMLLDVDTVVPLGLITNELISNALKHAFHEQENAMLEVSLWEEAGHLWLKVRDNGKGYDVEEAKTVNHFGHKLIQLLCDRMDAEVQVSAMQGTEVVIKMRDYQKAA